MITDGNSRCLLYCYIFRFFNAINDSYVRPTAALLVFTSTASDGNSSIMLSGFLVVVSVMFLQPSNDHETRRSIGLCTQPESVDLHYCRPTLLDVRPAAYLFNANLTRQMAGRCGEFYHPRQHRSLSASLVALLLLISGLENNPGPPTLNIGCINMNSVVHKGAFVIDTINEYKFDALAVCETKIAQNDPATIKRDCVPSGYDILHLPRPGSMQRLDTRLAQLQR